MMWCAIFFVHGVAAGALEHDISPDRAHGWLRGARADPTRELELIIALTQPKAGVSQLLEAFDAVSTPSNARYGRHLSNDEVHALVSPSEAASLAVRRHLAAHGVRDLKAATPNGDMLLARTTVGVVEAALGCEYYEYTHGASGTSALRTPHYGTSLPADVSAAIAFASPTVRLPSTVSPRPVRQTVEAPEALFNTPTVLRKLYSVGDAVGRAPNNKIAVTGFLGQHYSLRDLKEFDLLYDRGNLKSRSAKMATVGDDPTGLLSGVEAMLDAEYATALGANISAEFWGFKGRAPDDPQNEPFLKWLLLVGNTSDAAVPKLFSTSYGEDESSVSTAYADRINVEFVKAGARGITLLFASGDSGANCKQRSTPKHYEPNWPAASPYVTSVGGTTHTPNEEAVGLSSGGFSNRYPTPKWQAAAVATYLASSAVPERSLFNATGRGFPDIAAQATSYMVVSNLLPEPVDGTSCASPTAAGIFGLLNDLRLAAGKPPLGFVNPLLYQVANHSLNDVTTGSSGGCSPNRGYAATTGWDPVTGLGTPNYERLAKAVMAAL